MLTIITTTHKRQGCFALLERWMKCQTLQPDQWIVVGEDFDGYQFTMGQEVIKRKKRKGETLPSICENWLAAIPQIRGDRIIVIEDDDWYHPDYLATLVPLLETSRLAGVKGGLYYKLPLRKYAYLGNMDHATLACTAFTTEMIPFIERCKLHKSVFIDCYLWAEGTQENKNWTLIPNKAKDERALQVGFKLMPGGAGIGIGHSEAGANDPQGDKLRQWIGDDARVYRSIPKDAKADWMPKV